MPADFDWRAEDDRDWQDNPTPPGGPDGGRRTSKRRLLLGALTLLAVLTVGLLGYRGLRRYVTNATGSVEEDIQATHELVQLAAQRADAEILAAHLSSRDPAWTETQLSLAEEGLLYDRRPLGLQWQPEIAADGLEVDVDANLAQAELVASYTFLSDFGEDDPEAITLQGSEVYRLSQDRWLLSPPFDDYWGPRRTFSGRYIRLMYSQRDKEFSQRLAADLESLLATACNTLPGLACPPDVQLQVSLSENPADLLKLSAPDSFLQSADSLSLPSPTLVGKPVDEAGYRALYRGYGRWIIANLVGGLVSWQCCEHALFYQALLDAQLRQLGLKPWPIDDGQYRLLDEQSLFVGSLGALWQRSVPAAEIGSDSDSLLVYSFIEYLLEQDEAPTVVDMQRALRRATTFQEWLSLVAQDAPGVAAMELSWRDYLGSQTEAALSSQPIAWPDQDLILFCDQFVDGGGYLHRYSLAEGTWRDEQTIGRVRRMTDLSSDRGILITKPGSDNGQAQTLWWQDGGIHELEQASGFLIATGRNSPDSKLVSLVSIGGPGSAPGHYLLDLAECGLGRCTLRAIDGIPEWSPDSMKTMVAAPREAYTLLLGDGLGQSQREIGVGQDPFWLDDRTYVYLKGRPQPAVVIGSADEVGERPIIQASDLEAVLGGGADAGLAITHIMGQPRPPRALYLTATDLAGLNDYLFVYDRTSDELALLEVREDTLHGLEPRDFSPDGRWLVLAGPPIGHSDGRWLQQIYLFDATSRRTWVLPDAVVMPVGFFIADFDFSSWSADSQWYVQLGEGELFMVAPAVEFSRHIEHDYGDCQSVAWAPASATANSSSEAPARTKLAAFQVTSASVASSGSD
jgi:hypothetical protein